MIGSALGRMIDGLTEARTLSTGADPNIAEIVAMLTAGGDAWELDSISSPQTGVRGALSLTVNGSALITSLGKIGNAHFAEYGAGPCISGDATDLIAAVFDGGDWSVNAWHKPELTFSASLINSYICAVYTAASSAVNMQVFTEDGVDFYLRTYISDVGESNNISTDILVANNSWSMFTVTYTSATRTLRVYKNAAIASTQVLSGATSTDFTADSGPVYEIAGPANASDGEAYGSTDLLLICKGALSQANINYLYNSGAGRANSVFA